MRVLFTFLSITTGGNDYLISSKNLAKELLNNTPHDVLLTTNNIDFFQNIKNDRFFIRNNIPDDVIFTYRGGSEFNYNLKYLAFKNLPDNYDIIFYLDCDIKNVFWNQNSDEKLKSLMNKYDWVATRLNCVLKNEVKQYKETGVALFSHKIKSYDILNWNENDILMNSCLPSEHFLIFKYNKEKLNKFTQKWEELNYILQTQNGGNGSWGDGFEIGISAKFANYNNTFDMQHGDLETVFGFLFNGNKI